MPSRDTTRKLEVYSLSASTEGGGTIEYPPLFKALCAQGVDDEERNGALIAIPTLKFSGTQLWLIAYEGPLGVNPLIFSTQSAQERIQRLRSGEIVATKTHALFDVSRREGIVEYNHRGAKASDIARLLTTAARRVTGDTDLQVDLNPAVDEEFVNAVNRFQRIRIATLRIARPNPGWTDHYNDMTQMAEESHAGSVEMTVTAVRKASLSKSRGLVQYIKDLARQTTSILKGAKVIGVREGEDQETAVSLAHYIEHQKTRVRMTEDGHVDESDIRRRMIAYLQQRSGDGRRG